MTIYEIFFERKLYLGLIVLFYLEDLPRNVKARAKIVIWYVFDHKRQN